MNQEVISMIEKILTIRAARGGSFAQKQFGCCTKFADDIALEDETCSSQAERIEQVREELGKRPER